MSRGADRHDLDSIVRRLYSALFYAALPFILGRLAWKGRGLPAYRERWRERLGYYDDGPPETGTIWFHAVSVGEAEAAFPLIRRVRSLCPSRNVVVTCTTPTGSARILSVLGPSVRHVYLPYDLPGAVARFLDHFGPVLGVIMETEIWPNLYGECRRRGIPLAIVNGRLSEKSLKGYARLGGLTAESLSAVTLIAAQTSRDAERYLSLGAVPQHVVVAGNVKFDTDFSEAMRKNAREWRREWFGSRPVWVAGSTHAGEEEQILAAHEQVRRQVPHALLVLAPRHPERTETVAGLCTRAGFSVRRRSEGRPCDPSVDIFLIDTLGELRTLYGAADVAFVGGSLVPRGGHNVLEPAAAGVPVLSGPHRFNFADVSCRLEQSGAGIIVENGGELSRWVIRLLREPERRREIGEKGRAFVEANRGAVERISGLMAPLLPRS